jgi:hypothetical protein
MKTLMALGLILRIVCIPVPASTEDSANPIRGWISDVKCGAKGASTSHEECLRQCLHNGDKLALVTDADHRVLIVENPEALKGHEAHHVALYGRVDSNRGTLHVDRIEMLAQD